MSFPLFLVFPVYDAAGENKLSIVVKMTGITSPTLKPVVLHRALPSLSNGLESLKLSNSASSSNAQGKFFIECKRQCMLTGKKANNGYSVSFSNRRTKRLQRPNLQWKKYDINTSHCFFIFVQAVPLFCGGEGGISSFFWSGSTSFNLLCHKCQHVFSAYSYNTLYARH